MSETMLSQVIMKVVKEKMSEPEWVSLLFQGCADLNSSKIYPESYVDMLFQKPFDRAYSLEDTYSFLLLHNRIRSGEIAIAVFDLREAPSANCLVDENNEKLRNLPPYFTANFVPTCGGGEMQDDGAIGWSLPINATVVLPHKHEANWVIIPPTRFCPLEVGTTESEKTLFYLKGDDSCLARWAYRSRYLYILSENFYGKTNEKFSKMRKKVQPLKESLSPWSIWNKEMNYRNTIPGWGQQLELFTDVV